LRSTASVALPAIAFLVTACSSSPPGRTSDALAVPDTVRVVEVKYFPIRGESIDREVTGDWGESLDSTRHKVDAISELLRTSLTEGTRYHGYADSTAGPSLVYEILDAYEFLDPLPTEPVVGSNPPMTDYAAVLDRMDARTWIDDRSVDEVWIWGYHGEKIGLWESNMSSPFEDVSNSDRREDDLPVYSRTYTVYHYNYQRGAAEAMENHMHQLEALLNHFDGRDDAPPESWPNLLFWGKFVGSDSTHRLTEPIRAGWSHYPPNALHDYEWANDSVVQSDIRDWTPDGTGRRKETTCSLWGCDHRGWFIFWMQNIPGRNSGLSVDGRPLRNWWTFVSDPDGAFQEHRRLWIDAPQESFPDGPRK